jgi:sugar (pentulose or hexulose) kinase
LLTRAVGVGRKWVSVSTLAAVGTALNWVQSQFFADWSDDRYWKLVSTLAKRPGASRVAFDNYLAGERTSVEQRSATISRLTLSSTRQDILAALLDDLAVASAARLDLLKHNGVPFRRDVVVAGGVGRRLSSILHRDWPGRWKFIVPPEEATLRGLGTLESEIQSDG